MEDNFIEEDETIRLSVVSVYNEVIQVPIEQQTVTITIIDDDCKYSEENLVYLLQRERGRGLADIVNIICYYTAGELSLEKSTYNVIENEGSVEICVVLTGGVMSVQAEIELSVYPNTAKSGSK